MLNPAVYIDEQHDALDEVTQLGLAGLTVSPFWVKKFRREMGTEHPAILATVVGYPFGYQRTEVKQAEVEWALKDGAKDIEVMVNTSALCSTLSGWVKLELTRLATMVHQQEALLTVVFESSILTDNQLNRLVRKAVDAGADYVKNGTGVLTGDFSLSRAERFRKLVPPAVGVKVVGDGASEEELTQLVDMGVERISLGHPLLQRHSVSAILA